MTITSFDLVWHGEQVNRKAGGEKRFASLYRAISNNGAFDTDVEVRAHQDCPREGQSVITRGGEAYYATDLRVTRPESSRIEFMVTVDWTTQPEQSELEPQNPFERRALVEWVTQEYVEGMYRDRSGRAILNTAGDPPDPVPEKESTTFMAVVTKNLPAVPIWVATVADHINSSAFSLDGLLIKTGCARMMGVRIGSWVYEGQTAYRQVTMQIGLKKASEDVVGKVYDGFTKQRVEAQGWDYVHLNEGLYENTARPGATRQRTRILDSDGDPIVRPVPLDIDGVAIENPTPSNVIYLRWQKFDYFDFNQLPLT